MSKFFVLESVERHSQITFTHIKLILFYYSVLTATYIHFNFDFSEKFRLRAMFLSGSEQ